MARYADVYESLLPHPVAVDSWSHYFNYLICQPDRAAYLSRRVPERFLLDVAERLLLLRAQVMVLVNHAEGRFAHNVFEVLPGVGTLLLIRHIWLSEYRALWIEAEAARLKRKRDAARPDSFQT